MEQENYPADWEDWMYDQWLRENEDEEDDDTDYEFLHADARIEDREG